MYVKLKNVQKKHCKIKERTKETLYGLNNAYTEQFEKIINEQLLNMDAELKVMEQSIKADGYTTEKTTPKNSQDIPSMDNLDSFCGKRKGRHNMGFNQMKKHMSNVPQALFESSNTSILKRKLTAGALGVFFGSFGAHKNLLGCFIFTILLDRHSFYCRSCRRCSLYFHEPR